MTFLDNEYDTPDRLPGLAQDLQEFTRETGIQVKRLPRPERSLNQLAMWSELLQKAKESNADGIDMVLESGGKDVGIYALIAATIRDFEKHSEAQAATLRAITRSPRRASVTHSYFGRGRLVATRRYGRRPSLRRKKTGSLARQTHRRNLCAAEPQISIPISRQLIKFPITANMVTFFTLGIGLASAVFFAFGGYWNTLVGAFLCLWQAFWTAVTAKSLA